jgi:hypothetical protein
MRVSWLLLLASIATFAGPAHAARSQRLFDQWNRADLNADGRLSRAEAAAMPRLHAHFDAIDRNSDGYVSAEEVRAWHAAAKLARPARPRKPAGPGFGQVFAAADADGDGALDRREAAALPRIAAKFDRIDADADGVISRAEMDAWIERRRAARRR